MGNPQNDIYKIQQPEDWAKSLTDNQIIELSKESNFSKNILNEGRDYCYFLDKKFYVSHEKHIEYVNMSYTLTDPANLEKASTYDTIVEENETYLIHRISVIRDGELIDKLADSTIKVLDNENDSASGVINKSKKINISIKDLRLYDTLVLEDAREKIFTDKDFVRKEYSRYLWVSPDSYWAYGIYKFELINQRNDEFAYKKNFFRDENANLIEAETETILSGNSYSFELKDYLNPTDPNREIFPYIDFVTKSNWEDLSNFIYPYYEEVINKTNLENFAPNLIEKLNEFSLLEDKIEYAIEYVQNHIYYIYNADEMSGHKPQEAEVTYTNKQGDCKAKSILLKVIFDYLGLESSIILLNYNTDFYFKYYLPSLLAFNHVIVKVKHNDKTYYVDPTMRNEHGYLENRSFIYFAHYLEIKPNQTLQIRPAYKFPKFCIDEKINITTKGEEGYLEAESKYRYNRANNLRRYFKNTNKREIIDSWNGFFYHTLNYGNDRPEMDLRDIFKDTSIEIISDDKKLNELTIKYKARIENPYFKDRVTNERFLMYFDRNIPKNNVRDFVHKDASFWHNFDSEKYEINLITDQRIDTKEKFTIQESTINDEYFTYQSRKNISQNGGSVYIEFNPFTNHEIKLDEFDKFRNNHYIIADSNYGLGVDIIEAGLMNSLKFKMKKIFK
ncbi:DUF3857 domain-containing protein [Empedobacter falsenii]